MLFVTLVRCAGAGVDLHGPEGQHQPGDERAHDDAVAAVRRRLRAAQLPPADGEYIRSGYGVSTTRILNV